MDTLIVLCLALSSSFAAPQLYVPPNPPGSNQFQNPGTFNSLPTNPNNAFLPNTQSVQTSSTATESVQQAVLSIQLNQDPSSFSSQNTVNNQNPSINRFQETTENKNEYGQNSQNDLPDVNNSGHDIISNGFVRGSEIGNGQIITDNTDINNNLNNPSVVASPIGDYNQVTNNQGIPNISNGSSNGNILDNVDHNDNNKDLLANSLPRVQHSGLENSQYANGKTELGDNFQRSGPTENSAGSENSDFIQSQPGNFQNNEQHFLHQNSNFNQNLNNNAHAGESEANVHSLRLNENNAQNGNNNFINEQLENSQTHGQFISHQNSNSNQNIDTNSNVDVAQNLEVTNDYNMNQGIQNHNDNQRGLTANKIIDHQNNEIISQCSRGLVLDARGSCVRPEVSRNIYVYRAPKMSQNFSNTSVEIPKPKLEYNIVFVRTPERNGNGEPIIVPPPQQKTLVYVLSKKKADGTQEIIEVPTGPKHNPEVYYVNYEEGDNPTLPGGIELQTALSAAVQTGQAVNEVLNESLLREDVSHDNIIRTADIRSITEETKFHGIGIKDTNENNPTTILSITPNIKESINNDVSANNQLDPTYNNNVQRFNSDGSDKVFINNGVKQNTVDGIVPLSSGSLDGQYSATREISQQNIDSFDVQNPTVEGTVHQSAGSLNVQLPTSGRRTQQHVSFDGQRPTAERISTLGIGSLYRAPLTSDSGVPGSFVNSGNVNNAGNLPFMTNEGGYNKRQVSSTYPRQYNPY